MKAARFLELWC